MVGVSFEDWLPHNNYSHAGNLRVLCLLRYFVLLYSLAVWRIVPNFRWALSDQKGMSYLPRLKEESEADGYRFTFFFFQSCLPKR
jgi:hypothetical protein